MTRKFLEDLGIDKEVIDKIMAENGSDINRAKKETEDLKSELKTAKESLEQLKGVDAEKTALEARVSELEGEATGYKDRISGLMLDYAVEGGLRDANARNLKAVKALLDMDKISLDENGSLSGLSEQINELIKDDGTSFLFKAPDSDDFSGLRGLKPGEGGEPPKGNEPPMNYDDFVKFYENSNA